MRAPAISRTATTGTTTPIMIAVVLLGLFFSFVAVGAATGEATGEETVTPVVVAEPTGTPLELRLVTRDVENEGEDTAETIAFELVTIA